MFEKITPEQAGISSVSVRKFIEKLGKRGAAMHGVLFMRGDKIFAEGYWKPFHKDFCHRMYSQTKTFVSIAIGLLEEEGKLALGDKIASYFSEKIDGNLQAYFGEQTIRDMLTMCTLAGPSSWFTVEDEDRTHLYFNEKRATHPSGTLWFYDSAGSQVLSALVEKLSGKRLLDYLKEKLFNEMDAFQTATVLSTKNGDSWGDSAMIATLRDMAKFGRFLMNYGVWNGKRLMSEQYLRTATSKVVDNQENAHYSTCRQGYGYQIWRVCGNGFSLVGMGDQLTVCYPEKDLLFACVADNQGDGDMTREMIYASIEDMILDELKDNPLAENPEEEKKLNELLAGLELRSVKGLTDSPFREELSGQEYVCADNRMGITSFSFSFNDEKTGEFRYTNAQGNKVIPFGVNHNVFGKFPQFGYSNEFGGLRTENGFMYDDAVSFAWTEEKKIMLYVQIIDRYFGNASMAFSFKGEEVYAKFSKTAEDFLEEYVGDLVGQMKKR